MRRRLQAGERGSIATFAFPHSDDSRASTTQDYGTVRDNSVTRDILAVISVVDLRAQEEYVCCVSKAELVHTQKCTWRMMSTRTITMQVGY